MRSMILYEDAQGGIEKALIRRHTPTSLTPQSPVRIRLHRERDRTGDCVDGADRRGYSLRAEISDIDEGETMTAKTMVCPCLSIQLYRAVLALCGSEYSSEFLRLWAPAASLAADTYWPTTVKTLEYYFDDIRKLEGGWTVLGKKIDVIMDKSGATLYRLIMKAGNGHNLSDFCRDIRRE